MTGVSFHHLKQNFQNNIYSNAALCFVAVLVMTAMVKVRQHKLELETLPFAFHVRSGYMNESTLAFMFGIIVASIHNIFKKYHIQQQHPNSNSNSMVNHFIRFNRNKFQIKSEQNVVNECSKKECNKNWGILLPITSRGLTQSECWQNIDTFCKSLSSTTELHQRQHITLYIGIDDDDKLYQQNKDKLQYYFTSVNTKCFICNIPTSLGGKVCQITNQLACKAISDNVDFVVLLGDDIKLETENWKAMIEKTFADIAEKNNLPLGLGCVAFDDKAFKGFPTFPVLHKTHFDIFDAMFPAIFSNQDGDPYLFAIYNRFNASRIAGNASLSNTIGGKYKPRYNKCAVNWKTHVLSAGIDRICLYLKFRHIEYNKNRICLDVVIPSFRLNTMALNRLISINIAEDMYNLVTFIIVADDPSKNMTYDSLEVADNKRIIRLIKNEENYGVAISRNIGIQSSNADFILFLDDDVIPNNDILNHYYHTICDNPDSNIFVGCTLLPQPFNVWTCGIKISGITYFYDIANKMKYPPWGVTANLCVKGRSTPRFNYMYPKSGGGEDIDICCEYGCDPPSIVSAPNAIVRHRWWKNGNICMKHICGWSIGDSLCMKLWPQRSYLSVPNIPELMLIISVLCVVYSMDVWLWCKLISMNVFVDITIQSAKCYSQLKFIGDGKLLNEYSVPYKMVICMTGSLILFAQETTRLVMHVLRLDFQNFFYRFDFMANGSINHHFQFFKLSIVILFSLIIIL